MKAFDKAWGIVKGDEYDNLERFRGLGEGDVDPNRKMADLPVPLEQQPIEMLLDKVRRNIPGYHGLTDEQMIDVFREEAIEGLTTDEVAQMRTAAEDNDGENHPQDIANVEALIALRQRIMEM